MNKQEWHNKILKLNNIVDINCSGYSYEQIMSNKNCSKGIKYWQLIKNTTNDEDPHYLFKSTIAESWEFFDSEIINPIRNTNQIYIRFLNVKPFVEPSNHFRKYKCYTYTPDGTIAYNKYWDDLEDKIENGFEIDGVRITGRHFFTINFGRFRAIPVDELGNELSSTKIWTFLRFLDHQYYLFNELEECLLEGPYRTLEEYLEYFPLKTEDDFIDLTLISFSSSKGRRKGWTAAITTGIFIYNFTFRESSMNILAAYEKGHYGAFLGAIHSTKNFIDQYTPWRRVTDIKGTREHFIAGINTKDEYGIPIQIGYLSEIQAISFKDNVFKGIGSSANIINVEEAGKFSKLLEAWPISFEPLIRDGETPIGIAIVAGTAGAMESGGSIGLATMMYAPDAYKMKSYQNIYEEKPMQTKSGWFIDDLWYSPLTIRKSKILELDDSKRTIDMLDKFLGEVVTLSDKQGNSYRYLSDLILKKKRLDNLKVSKLTYQKFITQQPLYLSEAFLLNESSPFDTATAKEALGELMIKPADAKTGTFALSGGGGVKFRLDLTLMPVDEYPFQGKNTEGCWVIYEEPVREPNTNTIMDWKYIGGCLLPGEKVITDSGLKDIENVTLNNKLINKEGELVDIINFQKRWKKDHDVYQFRMANTYRTTEFTRGHPLYVTNHNLKRNYKANHPKYKYGELYYDFDFKFIRADKVKVGDWTKWPNIYRKSNTFDISTLWKDGRYKIDRLIGNPLLKKEFWWFAGLFIGDGWCCNGKIAIAFNASERYYIDKAIRIVKNVFNRVPQIRNIGENCIQLSFNNKQLCKFFDTHFGKYSYGKYLSEWIKKIENSFKQQLILGYLDSDGSIMRFDKYYSTEFVSVSLNLLEGFQDILFSLGIIGALSKMRDAKRTIVVGREVNQRRCYHLRLAHHATLELAKILDCPEDLKIKRIDFNNLPKVRRRLKNECFFSDDLKYVYFQIKKIDRRLYTGYVYNFECNTHSYISHHISQKNCDPIDWGSGETSDSGTHSFAATYIMDAISRNIVAEYIGRPADAEDYFEQLWRGLVYYNARLLYENNLKALFTYFKQKNKLYLLADEPNLLKGKLGYKSNNRIKGFHATAAANSTARSLLNTWSTEEVMVGQDPETGEPIYIARMHLIKSKGLLQEIIGWNSHGNFDRISSFGALMLLLYDRHYEEEDEDSMEGILDGGIFLKMRKMMGKENNRSKLLENKFETLEKQKLNY